jgi:hypothetical protein
MPGANGSKKFSSAGGREECRRKDKSEADRSEEPIEVKK